MEKESCPSPVSESDQCRDHPINHRMIYRNNMAILKELTLKPVGSAEVLFRVSLDDGLKYLKEGRPGHQTIPQSSLQKLEKDMDIVRYNLGLSWLMNPSHSRAAFSALVYGIKLFPNDVRLWLHAAEACISFLCSKGKANKSQDFTFSPIPPNDDLLHVPMTYDSNLERELNMIRTYFPTTENVQPSFEFAERCLMHSRKLLQSLGPNSPVETVGGLQDRNLLYISIWTTSSYVALRLKKFGLSLEFANQVLALDRIPRIQNVLVKCYRDLSLFLLGEADWTIFQPISFEENDPVLNDCAIDISSDNANKFLATVNASRKYHNILGYIMNPMNHKTGLDRLKEFMKENPGSDAVQLCEALEDDKKISS